MESMLRALGGGGWGVEGSGKKEKGLTLVDSSAVTVVGGEGIRGLNGNGKKYNKD